MNDSPARIAFASIVFALLSAGAVAMAEKPCCITEKETNGWCESCKHGYAFGVEIKNRELHAITVGEKVDPAKLTCDGCKTALAANGACDKCKLWYQKGVAYRSQYGSWLAAGEPLPPTTKFPCKACARAWEIDGRCGGDHDVGFVTQRKYAGKDAYGNAYIARKMLSEAIANEEKCTGCSIAIMTDGKCEKCSVTFLRGMRQEKK